MSVVHYILMRTFGRPQGILGRFGGLIMARTNHQRAAWVNDLLEIEPNDTVMEVVGPGMGIQRHYYFFRAACRPPSEEISVVRVAEISDQIWFDTNRFDAVAERLLQTGGGGFAFHIGAYRL